MKTYLWNVQRMIQNMKEELAYVKEELKKIKRCMKILHINKGYEEKVERISKSVEGRPYAENLKHLTLKGDYVRSKSEALLANLLYYHEIEYEYEKVIWLSGYKIIPDFTIKLPGGEEIYWEHLGMTGDMEYDKRWSQKSSLYTKNGIGEGNGLIITRDVNGAFDEMDALHKIELYRLSKR